MTLVEEDDKPEDGEEVELRRCESSQKQAKNYKEREREAESAGKLEHGSAGKRRKTCREDGASGAPRSSSGIRRGWQ